MTDRKRFVGDGPDRFPGWTAIFSRVFPVQQGTASGRGSGKGPGPKIVLVHSSDVHVDDSRGAAGLQAVLATARVFGADFVLLAGDTFENNQLSAAVLDRAGELLAEGGMPIVILPGNHDPALPGFGVLPARLGDHPEYQHSRRHA